MANEVVLRFSEVKFEYLPKKPILNEASFSIREGAKITLMGQNGAGKTTILKLIKGDLKPQKGQISIKQGASIAAAHQVIAREDLDLSILEYFSKAFEIVPKNIKSLISKVLEAVNFKEDISKTIKNLSGGQQARLLLAYALIQDPDILLLDEPTNNLDQEGIDHLISFLVMYDKTVLVISHDADFLNCFTEGVIYLNSFTKVTETYLGDYYSVLKEIEKRVEREQRENAQLEKRIKDRKEKVNFFAHKGGKMRKLAKKLKTETEELEENKVDVRREDQTIRKFSIPVQEDLGGEVLKLEKVRIIKNGESSFQEVNKVLHKNQHLLVRGPNGIGKSTLIRSLVNNKKEYGQISEKVRLAYYSQDFSNLDYSETVFSSLKKTMDWGWTEQEIRSLAAGFLIRGELFPYHVSDLSEGQKGLLSFLLIVLTKPGLLLLDEPSNHINFRHLPVIIEALNNYQGALIIVSHMPDFVKELRIDDELDLGRY